MMPRHLILSPVTLDQGISREKESLQTIAVAVGKISELIEDDAALLVLTKLLIDFLLEWEWDDESKNGLLNQIYGMLCNLFQKQDYYVKIDLSGVGEDKYERHPVTELMQSSQLWERWANEAGKLLSHHNMAVDDGVFCIGIPCEEDLADGEGRCNHQSYPRGSGFPIIGRDDLFETLDDAFLWDVNRQEYQRREIRIRHIERNYKLLGAEEIRSPGKTAGSHSKVKFPPGKGSWTLDLNHDPVLQKHLAELSRISGYPLHVMKYILIEGKKPEKKLRFVAK